MVIGTTLHWSNLATIILAVTLAFFFGYLLTFQSLYRKGIAPARAIKTAIATDTASIVSMETVDNLFILLVPGALDSHLNTWLFWWSLLASLIVAFIITVPLNRWLLKRGELDHHHAH